MSIIGDLFKWLFSDGVNVVNDVIAGSMEQNVKRRLDMYKDIIRTNPAARYDEELKRDISECRELLQEYVETEKEYIDNRDKLSFEERQEMGEQVNELKQALNEMLRDITARVQEYRQ